MLRAGLTKWTVSFPLTLPLIDTAVKGRVATRQCPLDAEDPNVIPSRESVYRLRVDTLCDDP